MEDLMELRNDVIKCLMAEHDYEINEAEELVDESIKNQSSLWDENADPQDLANLVASDGDPE